MRIYAAFPGKTADFEEVRRLAGDDDLWIADPTNLSDRDRRAFLAAEVAFGLVPMALLEDATSLRWIQLFSVGVDDLRQANWRKLGERIVCTNLRGVLADPMAQTVLAGILALNRGIDRVVRFQLSRDWRKPELHSRIHILHGEHILFLGAGSVNRRVRDLLVPFSCTFTFFARTSGDIHSLSDLDAELPRADIVCAALPDTPDTQGLIDACRIARMKPGALFVNVGRGSLVEEASLISALRAGRLRGAVLDVTKHEPLPVDDPLWDCPGLVLTQHTAAGSSRVTRDSIAFFGTNLARFRKGEVLLNVIDWSKGY